MIDLIYLISFFWFLRAEKAVLFWIYLWQLKEYHIGRFLDHFRTHQGKKLLWGFLPLVKILLLVLLLIDFRFFDIVAFTLTLLYGAESIIFLAGLFRGKFKRPLFTFKASAITLVSSFVFIIFAVSAFHYSKSNFWLVLALLIFDIFLPIIISAIVLFFQPFFVIGRIIILKKAKKKREKHPNLLVIGITGSYGKTSTKEFLKTIISEKFNVLFTKDHKNSEMGIAQTILKELNEKHEVFIAEMGAYRKGGIKLLCDIVKPKIGIVTGVNAQYMALFGSMENLLSAEGGRELLKNLPANGTILINGENKHCIDLYKQARINSSINKKIYTLTNEKIDADIWAQDILIQKDFLSFIAKMKTGDSARFTVNVLGKHNIQNLLGAILAANKIGMSLEEISKACEKIKPEQAGIVLKKGISGIDIINSSYSANPSGVTADLDYLSIFPNKKIIIMPCLIELGEQSADIHEHIGRKIGKICDLAIITTKDKFEEIKRGAMLGGLGADKIKSCANPKNIFDMVKNFCAAGDAVLLEGRVPYQLIGLLVVKKKPC